MARKGWKDVQVPGSLDEEVTKVVNNPRFGYTSNAEFYWEATRRLLKDLGVYRIGEG